MKYLALVLAGIMSFSVAAWIPSGEVSKVTRFVQWEPGVNKVAFQLESGLWCWIDNSDTANVSFVMALYMSQRKASWHCRAEVDNVGGFEAHRLHRVIGEPQ